MSPEWVWAKWEWRGKSGRVHTKLHKVWVGIRAYARRHEEDHPGKEGEKRGSAARATSRKNSLLSH